MNFWRISNHQDLAGLGGELADGRWHTAARGKRIVYLSEHPAVALVETLVNLRGKPALFPLRFQLVKVSGVPCPAAMKLHADMTGRTLAENQAIGDEWLARGDAALLRVPSVPSPESWNYLLNPLHRSASLLRIEWVRALAYDQRLFRV